MQQSTSLSPTSTTMLFPGGCRLVCPIPPSEEVDKTWNMPDIMVLMPPKTTYDESEKRAQFFSLCVSVALNVAAAGAAVAPAMAVGGLR